MSLPLLHAGRTNPGLSAQLDLRFAIDKSLTAYRGPTPSFSRASTGSYFDGSGVLRYAVLNYLQYSEQFENAYWPKYQSSVTANVIVAPDGKTTADKLVENSTNNVHGLNVTSFSTVIGQVYTLSIYAKAGERNWFSLNLSETGIADRNTWFNLANGTIGTNAAGNTPSITSVGNGWYRCSITRTMAVSNPMIFLELANADNTRSYLGDGTSGAYFWGAQLEASSTLGAYVQTTTAANSAPRFNHTFNGTSWVSRGLLVEEQRTNLCIFSEDLANAAWTKSNTTISANSAVSPDGNATADDMTETTSNTGHSIYNSASITAQKYTFSFYVKWKAGTTRNIYVGVFSNSGVGNTMFGFFDPNATLLSSSGTGDFSYSVANCGNGWYRISVTGTATSSGIAYPQVGLTNSSSVTGPYTGDGTSGVYLFGAQLEAGSFPTSYIPTTSASVTRSADVCQITGTDFSGFWNGTEGTLVSDFDVFGLTNSSGNVGMVWQADDNTLNNRLVQIGYEYSTTPINGVGIFVASGGSPQANMYQSPIGTNIIGKSSFAYKANDFALSVQGASVSSDTSGLVPSVTQLNIGKRITDTYLNGHIARLRYYNKRLPNATLQLLSDPDPTLNLQFALNKTLTPVAGPAPSFSRASTGTYFNASGVLTSASVNTPRFDHVFSGGQWVSRGLLIEEQRTNLIQYSEDISYGGWTKTDASVSVNAGIAPDGNMTADKLVENTASSVAHRMYYSLSMGTSSSFSAFFKAAGRNYVMMMIYTGTPKYAYFDILNGSVVSVNAPEITAKVDPVGNGWFRCSVTYSGVNSSSFVQVHMSPNGITDTYTGDGTSGMFIWGLQAENNVSFPTSYIPTTSTSVVRSADVCQITGTSFNWMWNQGEGSFLSEVYPIGSGSIVNQGIVSGNDGTFANVVGQIRNVSNLVGDYGAFVRTGNSTQVSISRPAGSMPAFASSRAAFGYKLNDFADSLNGVAPITDTVGTVPTVNRLTIGDFHTGSDTILNGCISQIIYYPARLTNTKLQQLST